MIKWRFEITKKHLQAGRKYYNCIACLCDASIFRFFADTINNVKWMSDWAVKSSHFSASSVGVSKEKYSNKIAFLGIFAYQIYVRNSLKTQTDYRESFFNEIISLWGGVTLGARLLFSHCLSQHPFSMHVSHFIVLRFNIWRDRELELIVDGMPKIHIALAEWLNKRREGKHDTML